MGLREKVALLIVALSFVQITFVGCGSMANNLKSPMKMISKPKRTKWTQTKSLLPKQKTVDESLKRRFNFPEVDYPLPPTFISTSYYNPELDFSKHQTVTQPQNTMRNIAQQRINKKNRKYNGGLKSQKKSFYLTYPDDKGTQMPYCLNGKDLFPSVDYPLDASELWKKHYWERILNTKPEVIQNLNKMGTKSKAKMKLSASKAMTKDVLKPNSSKSALDTNGTIPSTMEGVINNPITSNAKEHFKDSESALFGGRLNATDECNAEFHIESNTTENSATTYDISNFKALTSDLSNCNEKYIIEELYSNAQVTPSPIDTRSSDHEYVTPISKTLSPLTTVVPFSTAIINIGRKGLKPIPLDFDSREAEAEMIGLDVMADEIGCTVVYPEIFSSLTTSTTAPIYSNLDSIWMDPELDNHTLNTYSDEIEQYYILV